MLQIALVGFLFVQAQPEELDLETGQTQQVVIRAATPAGEIHDFQISAKVIPQERGWFKDGKFTAGEPGPGLLIFQITYGGETIVETVPIRVSKPGDGLSPKKAVLQVGDTLRFYSKCGKPKKWRVMPPWLGNIENGVFVADCPGKGVITVKTDKGFAKAKVVVEGQEPEMVQLNPDEALLFPGEAITFAIARGAKISVDPPDLGQINQSTFQASRPGNGMIWATWKQNGVLKTGKAFVRVLPGVFLKPGQSKQMPLPGRAGKADVQVKGQGLSVSVKPGKMHLRAVKPGYGALIFKKPGRKAKRTKIYPFVVAESFVFLGAKEVRLAPGQSFTPRPLAAANANPEMKFTVFPPEAGWVKDGVFTAGNYSGTGWLIGFSQENGHSSGGFVHLIITQ